MNDMKVVLGPIAPPSAEYEADQNQLHVELAAKIKREYAPKPRLCSVNTEPEVGWRLAASERRRDLKR